MISSINRAKIFRIGDLKYLWSPCHGFDAAASWRRMSNNWHPVAVCTRRRFWYRRFHPQTFPPNPRRTWTRWVARVRTNCRRETPGQKWYETKVFCRPCHGKGQLAPNYDFSLVYKIPRRKKTKCSEINLLNLRSHCEELTASWMQRWNKRDCVPTFHRASREVKDNVKLKLELSVKNTLRCQSSYPLDYNHHT